MSIQNQEFVTERGHKLPVDDKYLFAALSPTTEGTHYRDSMPAGALTNRQRGRILLQVHQILDLFRSYQVSLEGKALLDIGTGNGMVPCILLELSGLMTAIGADPYLDGEHQTSWQPHDHNTSLQQLMGFLDEYCPETISYDTYSSFLKHENYSMYPQPITRAQKAEKRYRFERVGAHDLEKIDESFDVLYCKAIEHIPDWDGVFKSSAKVIKEGGVFYLKHRSFFSYLGPHRYASSHTPWGHVLMSDDDYRKYVRQFYPERAESILDFYFSGLSYPRHTVSDMLQFAHKYGFVPVTIIAEPPRYLSKVQEFVNEIPGFWDIVREQYPGLCAEELFSGMHHVMLRKV